MANAAVSVAGVMMGIGVIVFASSTLVVLAIGGAVVYITYKITEPLRSSSIVNNTLRKMNPSFLQHHSPKAKGLIFPPFILGFFKIFSGTFGQTMNHVKVVEDMINNKLQSDNMLRKAVGYHASVFTCNSVQESTINGQGHFIAEFPIVKSNVAGAFVRAEGRILPRNQLKIVKLEAHVGGKRINFLSKNKMGPLIDAEYRDI